MTPEDRKLIESYLSAKGNSIDQMHNAERAREAVRRLLEEYEELRFRMDDLEH